MSDTEQALATFERDDWPASFVSFADQARAQVTWNDGLVRKWRLIGYEGRIASDGSFDQGLRDPVVIRDGSETIFLEQDRHDFAQIPAGAAATAFFELELHRPLRPGTHLGDVELRWVSPLSGDSSQQHAPILANRVEPGGTDSAMLEFGAIVALASDRYSGLGDLEAGDRPVGEELAVLREELGHLESKLGDLDVYHDFQAVLGQMAATPAIGDRERSATAPES